MIASTEPVLTKELWDRLSFTKFTDDRKQIVWDVSSLDKFSMCPKLYQYEYRDQWIYRASIPALAWGTGLHAGLEVYDLHNTLGEDNATATRLAIRSAAETAHEGLMGSSDNRRTLSTLVRAIAKYTVHYENDAVRTVLLPHSNEPAVEVRFEVPIPGTDYRLSGRIDRIGMVDDQLVIVEHKSTDASLTDWYWRRFAPNTQVYGYIWALREALGLDISGVLIDAVQTGVGFTRFGRQLFTLTEDQTDEWLEEAKTYILAAEKAHTEDHYIRNFSACGNYGGCKFRDVCSRPAGQLRESWIREDFVHPGQKRD